MRVQLATEPAPGRAENEDHAFQAGPLVGVFDGVTEPAIDTGCVHGLAWYVHRLTARLTEVAAEGPGDSLPDNLAEAIRRVRADHEGRCDLTNPATPAATACLIRDTGERLDYLILADSYLVTDYRGQVQAETDPRFEDTITELRLEALTAGTDRRSDQRRELSLRSHRLRAHDLGRPARPAHRSRTARADPPRPRCSNDHDDELAVMRGYNRFGSR